MVTISLCMIVKNEEATLEKCLNSVKDVVDEIVIVDTGSIDHTKEIAAKFTGKVYDFEWIDDFSAARNFSYSHAAMDYILWLDADDIILPEDAKKLEMLKKTIPEKADVIMMKYNTGFDSQGNVTFSYYRERLSKRSGGYKWAEPVHEYLNAAGTRITVDICVTHAKPAGRSDSNRNIQIYEKTLLGGNELSARGMYYYARELSTHERYADAIKWFGLFLDSGKGWVEDNITACGEMAKCYLHDKDLKASQLRQLHLKKAFACLTRSFEYDSPRAEICCQLGYYFKRLNKFKQAAFWFNLALSADKGESGLGFRIEDCHGYVPCLELAVCYDKLQDYKKASEFNEMAEKFKPGSKAVLYNRQYFDKIIQSTQPT